MKPKVLIALIYWYYYLEKYGPEDLKYDWTEFLGDIETYKSIVFVLASTLLPNVLSDIQVIFNSKAFLIGVQGGG